MQKASPLDGSTGKVYWTDSDTGKIQRANLNGSNVEDLVTGARMPNDIAVDAAGGKMYWADYESKQISRANLNGTNIETLVEGLAGPSGIVLDIARRKNLLDGSGMESCHGQHYGKQYPSCQL